MLVVAHGGVVVVVEDWDGAEDSRRPWPPGWGQAPDGKWHGPPSGTASPLPPTDGAESLEPAPARYGLDAGSASKRSGAAGRSIGHRPCDLVRGFVRLSGCSRRTWPTSAWWIAPRTRFLANGVTCTMSVDGVWFFRGRAGLYTVLGGLAYLVARWLMQRLTGTTIGKALFGLRSARTSSPLGSRRPMPTGSTRQRVVGSPGCLCALGPWPRWLPRERSWSAQ